MLGIVTQLAGFGVAGENSLLEFRQQLIVSEFGDLLGRDRLPHDDGDSAAARKARVRGQA